MHTHNHRSNCFSYISDVCEAEPETEIVMKQEKSQYCFVYRSQELHTKYNSKAEKTLTATMVLILLPIVMPALLSILDIFDYKYYSYLFFLRPICLDARAHFVTCYFYFTHPVFKQKTVGYKVGGSGGK